MISKTYAGELMLSCDERYINVGIDSEISDTVPERYIRYFGGHVGNLTPTEQWCLKEAFFKVSRSDRSIRFTDVRISLTGRLVNIQYRKIRYFGICQRIKFPFEQNEYEVAIVCKDVKFISALLNSKIVLTNSGKTSVTLTWVKPKQPD